MAELTLKLIRESNPRDISSKLEQALSYIVALRDKMLNYDSPATYNEFMYSLKKIILADTFPTDGREFLFKLKKASSPLGLIVDSLEKTVGGVTEDDAQKVCTRPSNFTKFLANICTVLVHRHRTSRS